MGVCDSTSTRCTSGFAMLTFRARVIRLDAEIQVLKAKKPASSQRNH